MKRSLMVTVMLLAAVPGVLAAQQDAVARIDAARRQTVEAGIPVSLIETRVAEGRAKGVPMERIAAAVERRAASLAEAHRAMAAAQSLTEADLSAGADAVEAGIGRDAIRAVIEGARADDRPVAIAVLTYLHQEAGIPVEQALGQVRGALARGPDALRNLPAQAEAARGRRGPPEGVGQGRPAGVGGGPPSGVPAPGQKPGAGKPANPGGNGRGNGRGG
jgi:hypothetical protein